MNVNRQIVQTQIVQTRRGVKTMTRWFLALALSFGLAGPALAQDEAPEPPTQNWSFNGVFGTFDRAAAQRGLQVYREVCQTCHSLNLLSYRHLAGIDFSEDAIAAIAASYNVVDGPDDMGEMFERPGVAADSFVAPFPNENAARAANNNALPPDLSLITVARVGGPDYIYAFLTGYVDPPADVELPPGMNYNAYFPGHQVAMPDVLFDDLVEYTDGTPATAQQMAWDVTTFLSWAAEPHMESRKQLGVAAILFLVILSGMLYAVKRKIWADV